LVEVDDLFSMPRETRKQLEARLARVEEVLAENRRALARLRNPRARTRKCQWIGRLESLRLQIKGELGGR
jgi:hypothetical protein